MKLNYIFYIITFLFFIACSKKNLEPVKISITTKEISKIEWTTANTGGDITSDGGSIISTRGVVYSTSPNPTIENAKKTEDGRGTGAYSSSLIDLTASTTYFVRAYAINSTGVHYGNEISFKTSDWTPLKFPNVWDWWTAENGLTIVNKNIEAWKGVNGNTLIPFNSNSKAIQVTNDPLWGGASSIQINPLLYRGDFGYRTQAGTNKSSKTIFLVSRIFEIWNTDNILTSLGVFTERRFGIWGMPNSKYFCFRYTPASPYFYAGDRFKANSYQFIRVSYDRVNGGVHFYGDSIPNFNNKVFMYGAEPGIDFTIGEFTIGSYQGWYGLTPRMSVTECLVLDGMPSQVDVDKYTEYVKAKYKLN